MNICVLYGGESCEHDVSVMTGVSVLNELREKHSVIPVYLKDGEMLTGEIDYLINYGVYRKLDAKKLRKATLENGKLIVFKGKKIVKTVSVDACVLATHGGTGENGALQGFLEFNGFTYTGSDKLTSAIFMDKQMTKYLLKSLKIKHLPYISLTDKNFDLNKIEAELQYPIIVKPCSLGSSIGISTAKNREELIKAYNHAIIYDNKILLEPMLTDFIEINCSAYRYNGEIITSRVESPVKSSEFLSFADKYGSGGKMSEMEKISDVEIPNAVRKKAKALTAEIYAAANIGGVARVDYLYDLTKEELYLNEVNTVPGSLAYYLYDIEFIDLIERTIYEAVADKKHSDRPIKVFNSELLVKGKSV